MKRMRAVILLTGFGLFAFAALQPGEAFAQAAAPKIGSSLIGKLEGPEIILDAKAYPLLLQASPALLLLLAVYWGRLLPPPGVGTE